MNARLSIKNSIHKRGTVLLGTLSIILLGIIGYVVFANNNESAKSSISKVSPAPKQTGAAPTVTQEPAPAEWSLYENTYAGYNVKYPKGWFISEAQSANSAVSISNVDLNSRDFDRFKVDIVTLNNPNGLGLEEFVASQDQQNEQNLGVSITSSNQSSTTIDGSPALRRTVTSDGSTSWATYISKNGKVYLLVGTAKESFTSQFDGIVTSFKFT